MDREIFLAKYEQAKNDVMKFVVGGLVTHSLDQSILLLLQILAARDQAATDLEARVREMETQLSAAQNALSTIGEAVDVFKAGQGRRVATKAEPQTAYTSGGMGSAWASGMDGVIE